jgi:SAM-dependent methyltransferase
LDIEEGDRLLEIGFGPGFAIEQTLTRGSQLRIVGIDRSEVMVRMATRRNKEVICQGRLELRLGSVEDPPLQIGETFDKIYAANTYPFWTDPRCCIARLRGLLTDGGRIAILFQPRDSGATNQMAIERGEEIAADLSVAGFKKTRLNVREMKPVAAVCAVGTK